MMTGNEYKESLRKIHPRIYYMGEKIDCVVDHPMIKPHVNSAAMTYDLACDPMYENLMTATSHLTGKKVNRFTHIHQSIEDLVNKVKMMRMIAQKTGTCFQRCVGFDAMNATFITTYNMDKKYGTNYHERFKKWMTYVQENDLMIAGAMTDVKGNRSLKPSKQADPDLFTHVVEKREDGVVICGAKAHMTGMANSHEMLILPTTNLLDGDQDYAIACAVPVDAEGITHIFGRQTNDQRRLQGDLDTGNSEYAIVGGETLTVLDHVFVPWDRVFMCGETDFAQDYEGVKEEAGSYYVNTLLANEVKLNCTRNMYEISRLAHDIAGGFIATLPHEWDLNNPETGKWIEKFFVGNEEYTARDRIKIARLLENMSGGTALAESMHGAGSPQAMKVMILRESNVEQKEQFAMDLAHVKL